jgi:hypothetical protein
MSKPRMNTTSLAGFAPASQKKAWGTMGRPWWVCCYASRAHFDNDHKLWRVSPPLPWRDGSRTWTLTDIKTFPSLGSALVSSCLRRRYAPFNNRHCRVLLIERTAKNINTLVEISLYDPEERT